MGKTGWSLIAGFMCCLVLAAGGDKLMAQQSTGVTAALEIVPQPVKVVPGKGLFALKPSTVIAITDDTVELMSLGRYLSDQIRLLTEYTLEVRRTSGAAVAPGTIVLTTQGADRTLGDEGYSLKVSWESVIISAQKPAGVFYGIQTFRQMIMSGDDSWRFSRSIPAVEISDKPSYTWRGFQLDCSRHFMSLDFVKRYIDLLAYHKMNVFHWHLTDDQGWRIEIKRYPELTRAGAFYGDGDNRHGGYYTQDEAREIVAYAKSRYITVVPEIEMPGHATAAIAAYPELSCAGKPLKVESTWGIHPNLFCAGKESTFEFIENVLTELCDIFPSPYIHIGGDEAVKDQWKACPLCQKRMKELGLKNENELQGYFTTRIDTFVQTLNRNIVGWDEILEGGPSKTAVVQSWRGMEGAVEGAKKGHRVISSPAPFVYLDFPNTEDGTNDTGWLKVTTLEKVYSFEPTPAELTPAEAALILGGECPLWTERAPQPEVDHMVFPRLCALAEVVWTPPERRNWADFSRRMEVHYRRLDALGVDYFTPYTPVGSWDPKDIGNSFATLDRDITDALREPGHYRLALRHDTGANGVTIEWAAILENGREMARDTHEGVSGKRRAGHNYRFRVDTTRPGARYTLRVSLRGDGGTDTKGTLLLRHFK
ncbi:beta-N-acetylhexosaminidase [bacterium]|nr:beta-N-acetylhexosaminidase [bacterium]